MKTAVRSHESVNRVALIILLLILSLFIYGFSPFLYTDPLSSDASPSLLIMNFDPNRFDDMDHFRTTREYIESERKNQDQLDSFILEVENGNTWQMVGIFVEDKFEISVVYQPSSNPGFVSGIEDTATKFDMASDYGTLGMLAHNHLAGEYFFELESGDLVYVIYGDGSYDQFEVSEIKQYQALSPYSAYSNFVDLEDDSYLSVEQLFYLIYQGDGELVLQTCIDNEGIDSWGRYFVIAEPVL